MPKSKIRVAQKIGKRETGQVALFTKKNHKMPNSYFDAGHKGVMKCMREFVCLLLQQIEGEVEGS